MKWFYHLLQKSSFGRRFIQAIRDEGWKFYAESDTSGHHLCRVPLDYGRFDHNAKCAICNRAVEYKGSFRVPPFGETGVTNEFSYLSDAWVHQKCLDSIENPEEFLLYFNATSPYQLVLDEWGSDARIGHPKYFG